VKSINENLPNDFDGGKWPPASLLYRVGVFVGHCIVHCGSGLVSFIDYD
jgi:hypothetical protein